MSTIAVVLDNYRLMHVEQFDALAEAVEGQHHIVGLELFSGNRVYAFGRHRGSRFEHITLFDDAEREHLGVLRATTAIVRGCLQHGAKFILISHYERPYVFLASILLRLLARRICIISDSKFDDYTRHL